MVEALLRVMHEFLLVRAKDSDLNADLHTPKTDKPSVSMFYLNSSLATPHETAHKRTETSESPVNLKRVKDLTYRKGSEPEGSVFEPRASNPDVNEIIVKIEMKKFQNLIENRIKHKNNLLQADMKRVYPLTKKTASGGMTLYDQNLSQNGSPKRRRRRKGR